MMRTRAIHFSLVISSLMLSSCTNSGNEESQWYLLLSLLLACHYLGDFCLTFPSMIKAKSSGKISFPILYHAGVHAILMMLVLALFGVSLSGCLTGFAIELVSHFVIDVLKGALTAKQKILQDNSHKPYWMLYGLDQLLHLLVIVALTVMFTP